MFSVSVGGGGVNVKKLLGRGEEDKAVSFFTLQLLVTNPIFLLQLYICLCVYVVAALVKDIFLSLFIFVVYLILFVVWRV